MYKIDCSISINIKNAPKQKELLEKIDKKYCIFNEDIVVITGIYEEKKRINDVYRYILSVNNNKFKLIPSYIKFQSISIGKFKDIPISYRDINKKTILIVIESPHKEEYTKQFEVIAPAQGKTGKKIEKFLCKILENNSIKLEDEEYNIVICNPVQFQASLYYLHKETLKETPSKSIRDKIWTAIFEKEEQNFKKRLLLYNPYLTINACTAKLKNKISESIQDCLNNSLYIANTHPCMWSESTILSSPKLEPINTVS